jgi:predicted NBD/HSP70 family sugar kinase
MREHNLALALAAVVHAGEPLSRAQVAEQTGLSRPAVTRLVELLLDGGLVHELAPLAQEQAGRPAVPLVPAPASVYGLGLELNVDYLGVRAIDLSGAVLHEEIHPGDLRGRAADAVLAELAAVAGTATGRLAERGVRFAGATLAVPGVTDAAGRRLLIAPNLGWRDVDLGAASALAALAPHAANEADLAARAELHARRPEVAPNFFYVSGEIGVGGATVLAGEIQTGRHGWAGEVGHVVVGGAAGALIRLEDVAGQQALLRNAGRPENSTVAELRSASEAGDAAAAGAVRAGAQALGVALSCVAHVADIDEVVLGGTFSELFDLIAPQVRAALNEIVVYTDWTPVAVTRARAGTYAALTGAALTALDGVISRPGGWI